MLLLTSLWGPLSPLASARQQHSCFRAAKRCCCSFKFNSTNYERTRSHGMVQCVITSEANVTSGAPYFQAISSSPAVQHVALSVRRRKTNRLRTKHSISHGFDHSDNTDEGYNEHKHQSTTGLDDEHRSHSHVHIHSHNHNHDHNSHHDSHSHGHHHHGRADACGCAHSRPAAGTLNKFLQQIFRALKIQNVASLLDASMAAMVAMVVCYFVALVGNVLATSWLSSFAITVNQVVAVATAGVYVLGGIPEAVELAYNLADQHIDTHVLMTLAVFGTLWMGAALEGALLLVLFRLSHAVEHKLTDQAQGNLTALLESVPEYAWVVDMDSEERPLLATARRLKAADVAVGTSVLVRPGEQVPLDGEVVYGRALVSAKHITGESLPILKKKGQQIAAGCLNHDGVLVVVSSSTAEGSTPSRIAKLAMTAQARKPHLKRWLDVFGEWYSKGVVLSSVLVCIGLMLTGVPLLPTATQRGALYRAMGLLTVASPCALVMVPLAYVSAIAAVTSRGLLIKGARVLDALAAANTVAFDKTGTLTTGTLSCSSVLDPSQTTDTQAADSTGNNAWLHMVDGSAEDRLAVSTAVALSLRSSHPVAMAMQGIGQEAASRLTQVEVSSFKLVPGCGVEATISSTAPPTSSHFVQFGSKEFVSERLPEKPRQQLQQTIDSAVGCSVVSVLVHHHPANGNGMKGDDGYVMRVFTFEDTIRKRSAAAVNVLRSGRVWKDMPGKGIRVVMLTGDNVVSASHVGGLLGISEVHAGLTPEEKLARVNQLNHHTETDFSPLYLFTQQAPTGGVIMVGDGLNDAPALAAASVGMAVVTTPEEATASAADVLVLNRDPISAIPFLLAVSYRTQAVVRQNLVLAFGSIMALALPTVLGFIPLWFAVMLHEGSTLLVALNSLRLLATQDNNKLLTHAKGGVQAHNGWKPGVHNGVETTNKHQQEDVAETAGQVEGVSART